MDVVLEAFDYLVFDRLYANILPIPTHAAAFDPITTLAHSFTGYEVNSTAWSWSDTPPVEIQRSAWQYKPSSQWFNFEPTEYAWLSRWDRDNMARQFVSLYILTWVFAHILYFLCASLSYKFVFDKTAFNHPKYLKNQISMEIKQTLGAIPVMSLMTVPIFVAEVRGHTYIYDNLSEISHPILNIFGKHWSWIQFPLFITFTDFCIYWIHRGLHSKMLYKRLHKPHHKWIMPTPFASHAFHPLDGFAQSVPYHVFPFLLPLHNFAYIPLFVFVQVWSVMIHDGEYATNSPVINGAACHTMHHLYFNYNYGQFTTLWDRLGGSYRQPNEELFRRETKMCEQEWQRQAKEMEKVVVEVEGDDDRSYGPEESFLSSATEKKVQ